MFRMRACSSLFAVIPGCCRAFHPVSMNKKQPFMPLKMSNSNRVDQIRNLLKSIETGDPGPVAVVNENAYIQHNRQTHEGSDGLAVLFKRLSKTNPKVNMVRGFEDGDYVFAHMEYDFSSSKICFEVFRFEKEQAVEHWENLQLRLGPNRSGRSMVDGSTGVCDLDRTEDNRKLVKLFVQEVLVGGKVDRLSKYIDEANYAEHNPHLSDDLSDVKSCV